MGCVCVGSRGTANNTPATPPQVRLRAAQHVKVAVKCAVCGGPGVRCHGWGATHVGLGCVWCVCVRAVPVPTQRPPLPPSPAVPGEGGLKNQVPHTSVSQLSDSLGWGTLGCQHGGAMRVCVCVCVCVCVYRCYMVIVVLLQHRCRCHGMHTRLSVTTPGTHAPQAARDAAHVCVCVCLCK